MVEILEENTYNLTTKEAFEVYNALLGERDAVTYHCFIHRVYRGLIPHKKIEGKNYFSKKDLEQSKRGARKRPKYYQEPVHIKTEEDFLQLMSHYNSELVDVKGLLEHLKDITGHEYTIGMINQRIRRNTILIAGYSTESKNGKRKRYWFPLTQISTWYLQPS